ncbi:MAG TPA: hypothetical protein VNJ46_04765 [Gaiellaceae bacterium]|nr:hypothetical protein [Gaiellaceae bacterium]
MHRDEVYRGAELLGLELDEHIANMIAALRPIACELGLRTAEPAEAPPPPGPPQRQASGGASSG